MRNDTAQNILLFTLEFPPFMGGVSTYNYQLAIGIAKLGYQINVLTRHYPSMNTDEKKIDSKLFKNWNIKVARKKEISGTSLIEWVFILHRYICNPDNAIDYILITDIGGQRAASLINFKKLNLKYFITVHGSEIFTTFVKNYASKGIMKRLFPIFKRYAESFYSKADGVIFVSEYTKNLFLKYFKKQVNQISVIHSGINRKIVITDVELRKKVKSDKNHFNLITISRIDARKNHEKVIKAIALMPSDVKEKITYNIVGEGPNEAYLRNLIEIIKLNDIVNFHGKVAEQRKLALLDLADIYIMPSKELMGAVEGLGISFLEAGARGLPLIGGNHGGIPEVIYDGINGFCVDPESEENIKEALLKLIKDDELKVKMGINSLRIIRDNFIRDKMVSKTVDFMMTQ